MILYFTQNRDDYNQNINFQKYLIYLNYCCTNIIKIS